MVLSWKVVVLYAVLGVVGAVSVVACVLGYRKYSRAKASGNILRHSDESPTPIPVTSTEGALLTATAVPMAETVKDDGGY